MNASDLPPAALFRLADGTELSYRLHGPEDGPPLALVHSLAMDGDFWAPVAAILAKSGHRVLTYDCRGHGRSAGRGPFTVEQFADDLRALAAHVGFDSMTVAGASMGGTVALAYAIRYPSHTRALGLIDTTCWYGPTAPTDWDSRARKAETEGLAALVPFQTERWFSDGFRAAHPEVVQAAVDTFLANDVERYAAACRMLGACDLRAGLSGIRLPTIVLVGREDYATPVPMAERLERGIPGARMTVLEGKRHLTPLEAPETVAAHLADLVAATPAGGRVIASMDKKALRRALGSFLTGVTIVTTRAADGTPRGFTANSFTSVSLDPPLVLVCLAETASSYPDFRAAESYCVNILSRTQRGAAMRFASKGKDKFAEISWREGPSGVPVLDGVSAWFACRVRDRIEAGDHIILLGEVTDFDSRFATPLAYLGGGFVELDAERQVVEAATHEEVRVGALLERDGAILMIETDGRLSLPFGRGLGFDHPERGSLAEVLQGLGVTARLGLVYAIAEENGPQSLLHVYYRGEVTEGPAPGSRARMIPCEEIPLDRLATEQNAFLLRRFLRERAESRFGIYVGDMTGGIVHHTPGGS